MGGAGFDLVTISPGAGHSSSCDCCTIGGGSRGACDSDCSLLVVTSTGMSHSKR